MKFWKAQKAGAQTLRSFEAIGALDEVLEGVEGRSADLEILWDNRGVRLIFGRLRRPQHQPCNRLRQYCRGIR